MASADSPLVGDSGTERDTDKLLQYQLHKPRFWTEKDQQEADTRFNAMNAPELPEQPLSNSEREVADSIIKNTQGFDDAFSKSNAQDQRQFELDLAQQVSCLSREEMAKVLPHINKALEPSGMRIASIPGEKGDEVWLGRRDSNDGKFHVADLIGRRFDYCVPSS